MAPVVHIKSKAEWTKLLEEGKAQNKCVIVDFSAEWCGPCKVIGPVFAEHAEKCDTILFAKIDVDEAQDVAAECAVSAMPTFQVYKDGKKVNELVGASKDKLQELISSTG